MKYTAKIRSKNAVEVIWEVDNGKYFVLISAKSPERQEMIKDLVSKANSHARLVAALEEYFQDGPEVREHDSGAWCCKKCGGIVQFLADIPEEHAPDCSYMEIRSALKEAKGE